MVAEHRQLGHLFAELRRRHVFRVAAVYGAAVFGLLQVLSVVFPALFIPDWVMTFTVVAVLAGFPVAVALGWMFDLTPTGVQRTVDAPEVAAPAPPPGEPASSGQSVVAQRIERLDGLLAREGVLPLARAVDIVGQLATALEPEHRKGRCHGRIAPACVIVAPTRRGADVVRLLEVDPKPGATSPSILSPVTWAAPEQLAGEPADARSDVYTLGLLLFRMLTGSDPHPGASPAERALVRRSSPALRLGDVFPARRYPGGVQRVLDRALALRREDRQADASELRQELAHAIDGERGYTGVFARLGGGSDARTEAARSLPASGPPASGSRLSLLGRMALLGIVTVGIAAVALRVSRSLVAHPPNHPAAEASLSPTPTGGGAAQPSVASPDERQALDAAQAAAAGRKHARGPSDEPAPSAGPLQLRLTAEEAMLLVAHLTERSAANPQPSALAGIRDSAAALWQLPAVPGQTRALAAFLAGTAQLALHSSASCATWVRRAVSLEPKPEYRQLLRVCGAAASRTGAP